MFTSRGLITPPCSPLEEGLTIPYEIIRREDRKASLEKARKVIEERYKEEQKQAEYESKIKARNAQRKKRKN